MSDMHRWGSNSTYSEASHTIVREFLTPVYKGAPKGVLYIRIIQSREGVSAGF